MPYQDDILTRFHTRKRNHIDELHYAWLERYLAQSAWGSTVSPSEKKWIYRENENPAYNQYWSLDYPKADKTHHPPNDNPDNCFRTRHIDDIRDTTTGIGEILPLFFKKPKYWINPADPYYRLLRYWGNYDDGILCDMYKLALGNNFDYINRFTDMTLLAGETKVKTTHIQELRKILSIAKHLNNIATYTGRSKSYSFYESYSGRTPDEMFEDFLEALLAQEWVEDNDPFYIDIDAYAYASDMAFYGTIREYTLQFQLPSGTAFDLLKRIDNSTWDITPTKAVLVCSPYVHYEMRRTRNSEYSYTSKTRYYDNPSLYLTATPGGVPENPLSYYKPGIVGEDEGAGEPIDSYDGYTIIAEIDPYEDEIKISSPSGFTSVDELKEFFGEVPAYGDYPYLFEKQKKLYSKGGEDNHYIRKIIYPDFLYTTTCEYENNEES